MLCHFAHQFPPFVESFLEHGAKLKKRFREESVTDFMMASLLTVGGRTVVVDFPNEPVTGADMQWDFVNETRGTFFRLFIQAKQLYSSTKPWRQHAYRHLFYRSGASGVLQAKLLCDTARKESAAFPLYALYHPASTCNLARADGSVLIDGVNFIDGFTVEALAHASVSPSLERKNRCLGAIHDEMMSLREIFCPQQVFPTGVMARAPSIAPGAPFMAGFSGDRVAFGVPIPPTPESVRQTLVDYFALRTPIDDRSVPGYTQKIVPELMSSIPSDVQSVLDRRGRRVRDDEAVRLNRWRITFVSTDPLKPDEKVLSG